MKLSPSSCSPEANHVVIFAGMSTQPMSAAVFCFIAVLWFHNATAADKASLMAKGKLVYNEYCKTCHQANGQGLGAVYPPVAKSDYLKKTPLAQMIKEIVYGKSGAIVVNGKTYNGVMAAMPKKYSDEQIAAVITYVYNSFGNTGPVVQEQDVKKHKKK
jgi:nitrite reductase (NO-forming)